MAQTAPQQTAWWLFAPPAALVGLRWLLQWQEDRGPARVVQPLLPFSGVQSASEMMQPLLIPLLAVLMLGLGLWLIQRRWGWPWVQRILLGLWVGSCLAGGAALLARTYNQQALQPLPPVQAQVLGSRTKAPNIRSAGGTELVLRLDTVVPLQQLLIDDPQAALWKPGQRLQLQWAQGRNSGWFVTGWQALPLPQTPATQGRLLP